MPTAFDDPGDHSPNERYRERVVDMELKWCLSIVITMMRQDVQEGPHQVKVLPSDVGDLKNRAYSLADKLGCGLNGLITVLDEDRNFLRSRGFQYACQLGDSLLQNLRWANIDFGYDDHDRHVQCKRDTQVLSGFPVSNLTIFGAGRHGHTCSFL